MIGWMASGRHVVETEPSDELVVHPTRGGSTRPAWASAYRPNRSVGSAICWAMAPASKPHAGGSAIRAGARRNHGFVGWVVRCRLLVT